MESSTSTDAENLKQVVNVSLFLYVYSNEMEIKFKSPKLKTLIFEIIETAKIRQ